MKFSHVSQIVLESQTLRCHWQSQIENSKYATMFSFLFLRSTETCFFYELINSRLNYAKITWKPALFSKRAQQHFILDEHQTTNSAVAQSTSRFGWKMTLIWRETEQQKTTCDSLEWSFILNNFSIEPRWTFFFPKFFRHWVLIRSRSSLLTFNVGRSNTFQNSATLRKRQTEEHSFWLRKQSHCCTTGFEVGGLR